MTSADRLKWEKRYQEPQWQRTREVYPLLLEHVPPRKDGLAFDLACGLGHNTLWLASQGYRVIAVDFSRMAIERAQKAARKTSLTERILFVHSDLSYFEMPPLAFDLIVVVRFLNRTLLPAIANALKPGGQLVYATLNWRWLETHPNTRSHHVFQPGELRQAFPDLIVTHYSEDGDHTHLIATKL